MKDAFYGNDDETGMHNVDVMTDVSAPVTAFTRYTVAPTTASRTSKYVFCFSNDGPDTSNFFWRLN